MFFQSSSKLKKRSLTSILNKTLLISLHLQRMFGGFILKPQRPGLLRIRRNRCLIEFSLTLKRIARRLTLHRSSQRKRASSVRSRVSFAQDICINEINVQRPGSTRLDPAAPSFLALAQLPTAPLVVGGFI